jgi:hypothetical protein
MGAVSHPMNTRWLNVRGALQFLRGLSAAVRVREKLSKACMGSYNPHASLGAHRAEEISWIAASFS